MLHLPPFIVLVMTQALCVVFFFPGVRLNVSVPHFLAFLVFYLGKSVTFHKCLLNFKIHIHHLSKLQCSQ